jgi:hypothetical protein
MEKVAVIVGDLGVVFLLSVVFAIPVWLLWNWLMPEIFALPEIGLLQAWGLILLSSLLFKSNTSSK